MPDREQIIREFRVYYAWTAGADWAYTTLAQACKDAADLLEDDRERIKILENTIEELNRELDKHKTYVEVSKFGEVAKPRRSRRLRAESSSGDA